MKPEVSIGLGLAAGALAAMIFDRAMPALIDHRAAPADDAMASSTNRLATITAGATVTAVALIAKDPTVFVIGGAVVVGMHLWHRHANMVNPATGLAVPRSPMMESDIPPDMVYAE
jgi:hypothetical protein